MNKHVAIFLVLGLLLSGCQASARNDRGGYSVDSRGGNWIQSWWYRFTDGNSNLNIKFNK